MADDDGFKVVGKKGKRIRNKISVTNNNTWQSKNDQLSEFDSEKFQKRFNSCLQDVRLSNFFVESYDIITEALRAVTRPESGSGPLEVIHSDDKIDLLSYGLGNFSSCPIARYQLCLLVVLREKLGDQCISCVVYDPVFTTHEHNVLNQLGFTVLPENEEGKRVCQRPTLAFLPHCGKALYNNLIWTNLKLRGHDTQGSQNSDSEGRPCEEAGLHNLVLIGNSFSKMVERTPKSELVKTGNYIMRITPHVQEVPLPSTFVHTDVFNDLAVHRFPANQLHLAANSLSEDLTEPLYADDDVEFVRKM